MSALKFNQICFGCHAARLSELVEVFSVIYSNSSRAYAQVFVGHRDGSIKILDRFYSSLASAKKSCQRAVTLHLAKDN